jgi:hypothetical protein
MENDKIGAIRTYSFDEGPGKEQAGEGIRIQLHPAQREKRLGFQVRTAGVKTGAIHG